jgi:hypothetical protein
MAANRDYWDERRGGYVCGFNPDASAAETLVIGRISDRAGELVDTLTNYGCHPTTLAWENTLLSPDYVGSLRQEVERATGRPCIFLLGPRGDLGPRHGFVGDRSVADQNGRQVAYAALAGLAGLPPAGMDFQYAGPVVSGATLGVWEYVALDPARLREAARFSGQSYTLDLPLKERPDPGALRADIDRWEAEAATLDQGGDPVRARDSAALAERARRWLAVLEDVRPGTTYPLRFSVHRLGNVVWIACGGEPYSLLQVELRRRFPDHTLVISPLAGDVQVAYLLPADRYGRGLYEEEPSILDQGCLELLIDGIAQRVAEHLQEDPAAGVTGPAPAV